MPDRSSLGSTIVLGGGGGCSERALTWYIVGISLGGGQDMYTERLVDSVGERERDAMTILCVTRGDSQVYRWHPREVTRAHQSMLHS